MNRSGLCGAKLPQAVRARSLLAVTFCDLAAGKEDNLKRLQARLETSAKPHFRGICFVANGDEDPAAAALRNQVLFAQIQYLAQEFSAERLGRAMAIARRVMTNAIARLGPGTGSEHGGLASYEVAEASKGLLNGDWVTALRQPLPQGPFERPSILRSPPASGARGKNAASRTAHAPNAWAAGGGAKERPRWTMIGAAALLGGAATFGAIQFGLIGPERSPVSNSLPSASEAVEQNAKAEAEKRRKAEAEAAVAEAHRKAEAESGCGQGTQEGRGRSRRGGGTQEGRGRSRCGGGTQEGRGRSRRGGGAQKAEAEAAVAEARGRPRLKPPWRRCVGRPRLKPPWRRCVGSWR